VRDQAAQPGANQGRAGARLMALTRASLPAVLPSQEIGNPDKIEFKAITDDQRIPVLRSGAVDIVAASHPIPVAVPYWTDCLVLLQQGSVAAISTDGAILAGLAAQDPATMVVA
jgi:ABC-type amino acid transport substrate-binding protein